MGLLSLSEAILLTIKNSGASWLEAAKALDEVKDKLLEFKRQKEKAVAQNRETRNART